MLATIRDALIASLPEDTPTSVIDEAARELMQRLHAPFWPLREGTVHGKDGGYIRAQPGGTIIGKVNGNITLRAGKLENGWAPVLIHGWMGGAVLK